MSNHTKIIEVLKDLTQTDLIGLYNDYCDSNQYDDLIKHIDTTEYPIDNKDMASMNDTLYIINGLGKVVTFSHTDDVASPLDYSDLATWLEDNDLLDKYDIEVD